MMQMTNALSAVNNTKNTINAQRLSAIAITSEEKAEYMLKSYKKT